MWRLRLMKDSKDYDFTDANFGKNAMKVERHYYYRKYLLDRKTLQN